MKKIKKCDLRLEKEVIAALTSKDLGSVKGGAITFTRAIDNCELKHPLSWTNMKNGVCTLVQTGISENNAYCQPIDTLKCFEPEKKTNNIFCKP